MTHAPRHLLGEPLPSVLRLADLARVIGLSRHRAWALETAGELAFLEILPRIGARARYSGTKVQRWIDGDGPAAPVSRFFRKGQAR
jgi:hypothetical protein